MAAAHCCLAALSCWALGGRPGGGGSGAGWRPASTQLCPPCVLSAADTHTHTHTLAHTHTHTRAHTHTHAHTRRLKGLNTEELMVYQHIRAAGNTGA
jgi:hypothetical protein